ncbi:hypothetical protein ACF1HJ_10995 [Streptomyces sp. NPDC013978]|uniref:hypothetical protein n=1 Tax=Streptomyces sp. NPDC013978 TaxID=3364869 RepID=UPI0036F72506
MAGELGLGYAFAGFINPDGASRALLRHSVFSAPAPAPATSANRPAGGCGILSVSAVVADTDFEARRLNWSRTALMARLARHGTMARVPTVEEAERELSQDQKDIPTVITDGRWPRQLAGSAQTVRDQLEQMTKVTGVDEVMVQDVNAAHAERAHSRALLARALDIAPR